MRAPLSAWTIRHVAVLLAALLAMEGGGAFLWKSREASTILAAVNRLFPGVVAWAVGGLDPRGTEALREAASYAWTGLIRAADLAVILAAARFWGHRGLRLSPSGLSARALLFGCGSALAFGLGACLAEWAFRLWGRSFFREVLLGGAADRVFVTRGVQCAWMGVAVLFAPAVEELLFRGVLLDALLAKGSPAAAIAGSAAIFALFHIPIYGPFPVMQLLGGLAFAWLTLRTGGILAAWILHAAGNAFYLMLQVLLQ